MPTKAAVESYEHKPLKSYPYGNPDVLLKRISTIAVEWVDGRISSKSAMSGVETILRQNKRI